MKRNVPRQGVRHGVMPMTVRLVGWLNLFLQQLQSAFPSTTTTIITDEPKDHPITLLPQSDPEEHENEDDDESLPSTSTRSTDLAVDIGTSPGPPTPSHIPPSNTCTAWGLVFDTGLASTEVS